LPGSQDGLAAHDLFAVLVDDIVFVDDHGVVSGAAVDRVLLAVSRFELVVAGATE
jgi:hypothetical protein